MIHPSVDELAASAGPGAVVPVWREVMADGLTPVLAYRSVADAGHSFLLESVVGGEKWARYSFVGIEPAVVFRSRGRRVELERRGRTDVQQDVDPLEALGEVLASYRPVFDPHLPRFWGGAVGYFGYDVMRHIERIPERLPPDPESFDMILCIGGTVLVFDRLHQTLKVVTAVCVDDPADAARLHDEARGRIASIVGRLRRPQRLAPIEVPPIPTERRQRPPRVSARPFREVVLKAQDAMGRGEVTRVQLSRSWEVPRARAEPFEIYRTLRVVDPSSYMYFLGFPEGNVLGASPEVLVRLEGGIVEVRPVAGTRWRGKDDSEDRALERELVSDEQEAAEHLTRVDLARSDVGRISEPGGVEASNVREVGRSAHWMHLVSSVRGRVAEGRDALDVFRAVFPAGTLTGDPKVRAMELIEQLEEKRRGTYGGAVGYIGFHGNMDVCIAARSVAERSDRYVVRTGASISRDSIPEREEEKILGKAEVLLSAIDWAGRVEAA